MSLVSGVNTRPQCVSSMDTAPTAEPVHAPEQQLHRQWLEGMKAESGAAPRPRALWKESMAEKFRRYSVPTWDPVLSARQRKTCNLRLHRHHFHDSHWAWDGLRLGMLIPEFHGLEILKHASHDEEKPEEPLTHEEIEDTEPMQPFKFKHEEDYEEYTERLLVKWDDKDDKEKMLNVHILYRIYIMLIGALCTLCTSFTSSAPSGIIPQMVEEFQTTKEVVKASIYLFVGAFCVGPLIWGPVSELFGRRIVFITAFLGFTCFNVGCMLSTNIASMIVCRFFAGACGSVSMAVAPSLIASLWSLKYLQTGIVVFSLAPCAGPCLGPIVSGYITNAGADWRWVFRVCAIFSFVLLLLVVFTMGETLDSIRLKYKAQRLRRETGDDRYIAPIEFRHIQWSKIPIQVLGKPFKILLEEPMLMALTIYTSFVYGVIYLLFDAYPIVFGELHNMRQGAQGLMFLGLVVGNVIAAIYCVSEDNRDYIKKFVANGNKALSPERRLNTALIGGPLITIGLFWFAWTSFPSVSFWSPLVAGGVADVGLFFIFLSLLTYLTETYAENSASANSINTIVRSAFGCGFPMFGAQMYHNLNPRWASTVIAFISLVLVPIPFVLVKFGPTIRSWSKNAC